MGVIAIVQARMGSTRLPGKVLADVAGRPMLARVIERLSRATRVDKVVVATTTSPADEPIVRWCRDQGVAVFRGSEQDVLERYLGAAREHGATVVVRITADCPLIDPACVDQVIERYQAGGFDYVSNVDPPTFPDGLDTEVFSRAALEEAGQRAQLRSEREHVTPYIRGHPERFRHGSVTNAVDLSSLRWTIDEPRDLELIRRIYSALGERPFRMADVVQLLQKQPALAHINAGIERNEGYKRSLMNDGPAKQEGTSMGSRTGQRLYAKARERIPGGTQLLSKRPEMFLPREWPAYYSRSKGAEVWDLDGNRYVDMSYSGIGACVLGYADADVDAAAIAAIQVGVSTTLNAPEEVELADLLCDIHPWAEQVRFARCGGEAMAMAVRIARAATGKDRVAFSGYHGWHDWYLAANLASDVALDGHLLPGLAPKGVPRGLIGSALPFRYNQIEELGELVRKHGDEIGVIVMEPLRSADPAPGFIQEVREIADRIGAVLVFDEVTAAFRMNSGGAHLKLGVEPDIAVFAKAMSNGYAMAAVIGRASVMQHAQETFISSTYWTERIGPSAALATIRKHARLNVGPQLVATGRKVKAGWLAAGRKAGIAVSVDGMDPLAHFHFDVEDAQAAHTLFTQLMLDRGFLANKSFYATYAHDDKHVTSYLTAVEETFALVADAAAKGTVRSQLRGPAAHVGFRRLT